MKHRSMFTGVVQKIMLIFLVVALSASMAFANGDMNSSITLQESYYIGDGWTAYPEFNSFPPHDVVYGDGKYIAVGGYGTVMHSQDGYNWSAYSKLENIHLHTVAWDGSKFLTFGTKSNFLSDSYYRVSTGYISTDAKTWTKIDYEFDEHISGVIWGKDRFVASGSKSVYTSMDGIRWTKMTPTVQGEFFGWDGVLYQNGHFFIAASGARHLLVSSDGVKWTYKKNDSLELYNIVWTGKQYIGSGVGLFTSTDGLTWKKLSNIPNGYYPAIVYGGNTIIATGVHWLDNGKTKRISLTSKDGIKWASHDISLLPSNVNILYPTKNGIVGLGTNGDAHTPDATIAFKTTDGIKWTSQIVGTPGNLNGIATNGERSVAVGDYGVIVYTDDGVNWKSSNPISSRPHLQDVAWDGKKFVAVGNGGAYYSADSINWKSTKLPTSKPYPNLDEILWTGKFFVAASQISGVFTSKDGITWTAVSKLNTNSPSHWVQAMVWDGERVLAAVETYHYDASKRSYKIMQTTDGTTWTDVTTIEPKGDYTYVLFLSYNGSSYTIADKYNLEYIWLSNDGRNWSKTKTNLVDAGIEFLTSFEGQFYAFGDGIFSDENDNIYTKTTYYTSSNGKTWTEVIIPDRHPDFEEKLFEVLTDGIDVYGQYVFVGSSGMIMTKAKTMISYEDRMLPLTNRTGTVVHDQGKIYVPLRAVAEHMGYKVLWDGPSQKVQLQKDINNKTFTADFYLKDATTKTFHGRTYVQIDHLMKMCDVTYKKVNEKGTTIFSFESLK